MVGVENDSWFTWHIYYEARTAFINFLRLGNSDRVAYTWDTLGITRVLRSRSLRWIHTV